MNKKVLLLHGWGGSDFPHWQSWLAGEIAKDYGTVKFLKFSDFNMPKLDVWMDELQLALEDFQPDIVVCHSLANTLWMHLCNTQTLKEIQKLYLVAPPTLSCKIEELQEFFPVEISQNLYAQNTLLIASTNDPYMDIEEAKSLANTLNIPMKIVENAGHINADSGYGQWQWMLKELRS